MDSGTLIITIVFLVIVIFPFAVTGYSRKKKKKNLFCKLTEMAQTDNSSITQHEFCGDFVIGLDETANQLFFFKKRETTEIAVKINLKDFRKCSKFCSKREIGSKKEHYDVIDKLELCFYPKDRTIPNVLIEIYNDEHDSLTLSGELQLIEKWEKMLNDRMKKGNDPKFAPIPKTEQPIQGVNKSQPKLLVKA
jgi:hypothetical protein